MGAFLCACETGKFDQPVLRRNKTDPDFGSVFANFFNASRLNSGIGISDGQTINLVNVHGSAFCQDRGVR